MASPWPAMPGVSACSTACPPEQVVALRLQQAPKLAIYANTVVQRGTPWTEKTVTT